MGNPFRPSAGGKPPILVGRDEWLRDFEDGLIDGPGAPARLALITGKRGTGKTVLLTAMGERARSLGWTVVDETARSGLNDRLKAALQSRSTPLNSVKSLSVDGVGGIEFNASFQEPTLRSILSKVLSKRGRAGVFITVDEVQAGDVEELRELATVTQHLIRDEMNIALCLAGLPTALSILHNDEILTFLRRAHPIKLAEVSLAQVKDSFREVFALHGKAIGEDSLDMLTEATFGYPYMIQLVGYHVWRKSGLGPVSVSIAREGIEAARVRLGDTVHGPAVADLSPVDRTFLLAMSIDGGPSKMSELAKRLNRNPQYMNNYKLRLIAAGIIQPAGYGLVDFALPGLREWLREHANVLSEGSGVSGKYV